VAGYTAVMLRIAGRQRPWVKGINQVGCHYHFISDDENAERSRAELHEWARINGNNIREPGASTARKPFRAISAIGVKLINLGDLGTERQPAYLRCSEKKI